MTKGKRNLNDYKQKNFILMYMSSFPLPRFPSNTGNVLGIGNSSGVTQLWDVAQQKLVRSMAGHESRVTTLSWNSYILSSGSRSGQIFHHDVRVADHHVATLAGHSQVTGVGTFTLVVVYCCCISVRIILLLYCVFIITIFAILYYILSVVCLKFLCIL